MEARTGIESGQRRQPRQLGGRMDTMLDKLRQDLRHQLEIPDDIDWDYFLDTAKRALIVANKEGRNMREYTCEAD